MQAVWTLTVPGSGLKRDGIAGLRYAWALSLETSALADLHSPQSWMQVRIAQGKSGKNRVGKGSGRFGASSSHRQQAHDRLSARADSILDSVFPPLVFFQPIESSRCSRVTSLSLRPAAPSSSPYWISYRLEVDVILRVYTSVRHAGISQARSPPGADRVDVYVVLLVTVYLASVSTSGNHHPT